MQTPTEYEELLAPLPELSADEIKDFERSLYRASSVEAVKGLLADTFNISAENLDFLEEHYDIEKLRELYTEHIAFDLKSNVTTIPFISEEKFREMAKTNPESFAKPDQVDGAVKHRPSLPGVVRSALEKIVPMFRTKGYKSKEVTFYDIGCGSGRIVLLGASHSEYEFRRFKGVDFCEPLVELAKQNVEKTTLPIREGTEISFIFQDAASFTDYNGVNLVFMYNPINDKDIMREIEINLSKHGTNVVLVYIKPEHGDIFQDAGWKCDFHGDSDDEDQRFNIYSRGFINQPVPSPELTQTPN